jgi:hypothetical protein
MARAHVGALLTRSIDYVTLWSLGRRVESILTENQLEVTGSFTCCLLPPKSMSDAVRVGQAEIAGWQIELVEKVRRCPDSWWPRVRVRVLDHLEKGALAAYPGYTDRMLAAERERVGNLLDRVRTLSDAEFEMEKENLAAAVKAENPSVPEGSLRGFNAAFFLLMPGSVEIYDRLIRHRDGATGGLR